MQMYPGYDEDDAGFDEYGGVASPQKRGKMPARQQQLYPGQALPLHQQYVYQQQMQGDAYRRQQIGGPPPRNPGPGGRKGRGAGAGAGFNNPGY